MTKNSISSDQIEQYLKLGRGAIDEWFDRRTAMGQEVKVFRVEPENTVNVKSRKNMATQKEAYQRYLLWKAEVDKAASRPENKKVLEKIRKKYKLADLTNSIRLFKTPNSSRGRQTPQNLVSGMATRPPFLFKVATTGPTST